MEINKKNNIWSNIEDKFPKGAVIEGIIEFKAHYGIFLNVGDSVFKGFIPITELFDMEDKINFNEDKYLVIGSEIKVMIIDYTFDERYQIWMSIKRISQSTAVIE
ncbi:MAG: S1 RNA-binding domain-containing protein [Cytophagales bacterium]|nr:MAG: S1 RNA-binding domain-containing protein [Cytophagales bacterium]